MNAGRREADGATLGQGRIRPTREGKFSISGSVKLKQIKHLSNATSKAIGALNCWGISRKGEEREGSFPKGRIGVKRK